MVLPVPLNKDCNEYMVVSRPLHADACRYARLALAVWVADAAKFPLFHQWLFEAERPPLPAEAMNRAAELVGRPALEAAMRSPRVEQILARNCRLFHVLDADALPKLILGNYVSTGRLENREAFYKMLEDFLGIWPEASNEKGKGAALPK